MNLFVSTIMLVTKFSLNQRCFFGENVASVFLARQTAGVFSEVQLMPKTGFTRCTTNEMTCQELSSGKRFSNIFTIKKINWLVSHTLINSCRNDISTGCQPCSLENSQGFANPRLTDLLSVTISCRYRQRCKKPQLETQTLCKNRSQSILYSSIYQ